MVMERGRVWGKFNYSFDIRLEGDYVIAVGGTPIEAAGASRVGGTGGGGGGGGCESGEDLVRVGEGSEGEEVGELDVGYAVSRALASPLLRHELDGSRRINQASDDTRLLLILRGAHLQTPLDSLERVEDHGEVAPLHGIELGTQETTPHVHPWRDGVRVVHAIEHQHPRRRHAAAELHVALAPPVEQNPTAAAAAVPVAIANGVARAGHARRRAGG
mmetsp:Transcript_43272/g.122582  ORF Transcript_43272/g.122582 Transcript_43272/m.122582 type:complete len:217 (+) Transcript_43272:3604-4254(+)